MATRVQSKLVDVLLFISKPAIFTPDENVEVELYTVPEVGSQEEELCKTSLDFIFVIPSW